MSGNILETKDITKKFHGHTVSDHVSLHVKEGEIYGLVGRNGAGKTTLMKMIANIYTPNSGKVMIHGKEQKPSKHSPIGALIEEPALMPNLSARDNLLCKCYMMGVKDPAKHADELLHMVSLEKVGKKHVSHFSLGMRQRVGIALALVGWPRFVLLDEPVNGLDPQGIQEIRNIVLRLRDEKNITFMISSHLLGELQKMADRFGIISEGKLVKELKPEEIDNMEWSDIRIRSPKQDKVMELFADKKPSYDGEYIHIFYGDDEDLYIANKKMVDAKIPVEEITLYHQKGEEIFLELMGGEHYV